MCSHGEMLILPVCLVKLGHYKAEEWQDSSKTWLLNDQLGIQIVVTVRLSTLVQLGEGRKKPQR